MLPRFHLAFPVHDLCLARKFYVNCLGCTEGRSASTWIDFNFFGHQLSAHLQADLPRTRSNTVDDKDVPIPHFGLILDWQDWHMLAARLQSLKTVFVIDPYIRFQGRIGEQATMFLCDPSGNALEFKAFQDETQIFAW